MFNTGKDSTDKSFRDSLLDRFLRYIQIDTVSIDDQETVPSSPEQWTFANMLVEDLHKLGIGDAFVDRHCTVYAHIPATPGMEDRPALGLIAHMDTVENGHGIRPRVIENYDGGDVRLESSLQLTAKDFPGLPALRGRTLIVSDGTTILGADDKAGLTAIMGLAELLMKNDSLLSSGAEKPAQSGKTDLLPAWNEIFPHGRICIAFTPDEEVGTGVLKFDLGAFGADYAVTVDGGEENIIEAENFYACSADITARGVQAHPGSAKGIMVNAAAALAKFHTLLPADEVPEQTEDRQGFYHLLELSGDVENASAHYIIRDFDPDSFEHRKQTIRETVSAVNRTLGREVLTAQIKDSYRNMAEIMKNHPAFLREIEEAIRRAGMQPSYLPIRGGTDGARLTFQGLPCPNLGAGAYGFHGLTEHCTAEGMENAARILLSLIRIFAEKNN